MSEAKIEKVDEEKVTDEEQQQEQPVDEQALPDEGGEEEKSQTEDEPKNEEQIQQETVAEQNIQKEPEIVQAQPDKAIPKEEAEIAIPLPEHEQPQEATTADAEADRASVQHSGPAEGTMEARLALLRTFSSEYFLQKHTESFKCLEQYLCSRSDLRLTLNFFPPLFDPGLDDILNYIPPEEEPDPDGADKYIKMCKDLTIVPISRVIHSLGTDTLNLKYYGITFNQMRGIADALKVNSNIKYWILEDNWMSPESTNLISAVLQESNSIRVLNLRECRLGEEGAEKLCEGIASTQFLQELDLSFNSLGDKGLQILQPSIIENTSIKKLNISHNELTEESAPTLEQILLENKAIEDLDLSWNGFYTGPGNKKLCNGLVNNELISSLSLAFNGIGTGAAMRPISKYLRKTKVLRFLDLSWNRITKRALKLLRAALVRNKSLNQVKVGNNIFTPEEAYNLANFFSKAKGDNMTYLDMEDMCVNKDFKQLRNQFRRQGKTITHGHIISNYEIHGPNINKLLFERCKLLAMKPKKKKKKRDFGHFILSLPDKPVTSQKFQELLKKKKVKKIDKDLLAELLSRFPAKRKKVDTVAMKEAFMNLYPDTKLPEEKKKKKKRKRKKKKKKQ